jgi:hypothetical protein
VTTPDRTAYLPGERVSLVISDAAVTAADADTVTIDAAGVRLVVQTVGSGIEINRVWPAEGEPLPGEIWRDSKGGLWFVAAGEHDTVMVGRSRDQHPGFMSLSWDVVNRTAGPIRRVWRDTAPAAGR